MELILIENVDGLGFMGELVKVKPGYARNFLLPQGLAVVADKASKKEIEHRQRQIEAKIRRLAADAEKVKEQIEGTRLSILKKAGEGTRLYGSVTGMDIEAALKAKGFGGISRKQIIIHEPIRALGDFTVTVKLLPEISAELKLTVEPEGGEGIKYEDDEPKAEEAAEGEESAEAASEESAEEEAPADEEE